AEAGGQRYGGEGKARLVDQLLGEEHAAGLRHGDGRGAEMLLEKPTQLPAADAEPLGQGLDARLLAIERALGDEGEAARHGVRGAAPGAGLGRRLPPAAQAGAKPCLLRPRRGGEEAAVPELGGARRADRPAVDSGRGHADEQAAVETRIAGREGAVAGFLVELFHVETI